MGISPLEFQQMQERVARNRRQPVIMDDVDAAACEREVGPGGLHQQIIDWCNSQWPQVKFIHSRTDKRSTVEGGVHDFTIYLPQGRNLNIECKAKGKKQTIKQLGWALQLEQLGHRVHVVTSKEQFLKLV